MRLRHGVGKLLLCCSVLWGLVVVVVSSPSRGAASQRPPCDSKLLFSSEVSSVSEGNWNIQSRSLSPWRWRISTEKDRIPSTLWEAECSSDLCSGLSKPRLNSAPIYQNLLVLRRQEGRRCYTATFQSVAVGCTCTWTRTKTRTKTKTNNNNNN